MKKTLLTLSIVALLMCMVMSVSFAGTTVITVEKDTEDAGKVIKDAGHLTNLNGAMVWNGSEWVVNNSWAHMYFSDLRTGKRLAPHASESRNFHENHMLLLLFLKILVALFSGLLSDVE